LHDGVYQVFIRPYAVVTSVSIEPIVYTLTAIMVAIALPRTEYFANLYYLILNKPLVRLPAELMLQRRSEPDITMGHLVKMLLNASELKQEILATAKMTARCALYRAYGCPEKFWQFLSTPRATFPEVFNGLLFRRTV